MTDVIERIHSFWFGELDAVGLSEPRYEDRWFKGGNDVDQLCHEQFGEALQQALAGQLTHWSDTERGLVALVVLLDQFSRNIYRETPDAFSGDSAALALSRDAIASGRYQQLPVTHRVFMLLPLEHNEDIATQNDSVAHFEILVKEANHPRVDGFLQFAIAHRDVIERFGRFPHRNKILGRTSTAQELEYLEKHGGF